MGGSHCLGFLAQVPSCFFPKCCGACFGAGPFSRGFASTKAPCLGTRVPRSGHQKQALEMLGLQPGAPLGDGLS